MIEFDENLNPIEGGKPTGDDMPPIYQGPASGSEMPPARRAQEPPAPEPIRQTPPPPTPPPSPPASGWQTPPPPPPREPRGKGFGMGLIWLVVVGSLVVAGLAVTNIDFSTSSDGNQPQGITVYGEGIAYASPDIAKVRFSVQYTARTVTAVRDNLDGKITDVRDRLDDFDIASKDIKTVEYSLYPERDYNRTPAYITGYTGRHSLEVTVRDLDKVNDVVDAITKVGVNDISNVTFDIDDPDEWIKEARTDAVKEAKNKAKDIADDADIKLGKLISIQESVGGIGTPIYYDYGRGGGGEDIAVSPSIEPGSQEIRVNVTLIYKIG